MCEIAFLTACSVASVRVFYRLASTAVGGFSSTGKCLLALIVGSFPGASGELSIDTVL